MAMTESDKKKLTEVGMALAVLFAAYKWAPGGQAVKAAILGVGGVVIANQLPFVGPALKY